MQRMRAGARMRGKQILRFHNATPGGVRQKATFAMFWSVTFSEVAAGKACTARAVAQYAIPITAV